MNHLHFAPEPRGQSQTLPLKEFEATPVNFLWVHAGEIELAPRK